MYGCMDRWLRMTWGPAPWRSWPDGMGIRDLRDFAIIYEPCAGGATDEGLTAFGARIAAQVRPSYPFQQNYSPWTDDWSALYCPLGMSTVKIIHLSYLVHVSQFRTPNNRLSPHLRPLSDNSRSIMQINWGRDVTMKGFFKNGLQRRLLRSRLLQSRLERYLLQARLQWYWLKKS